MSSYIHQHSVKVIIFPEAERELLGREMVWNNGLTTTTVPRGCSNGFVFQRRLSFRVWIGKNENCCHGTTYFRGIFAINSLVCHMNCLPFEAMCNPLLLVETPHNLVPFRLAFGSIWRNIGPQVGLSRLTGPNLVDAINFLTCQVFSGGRHVFIATISRR